MNSKMTDSMGIKKSLPCWCQFSQAVTILLWRSKSDKWSEKLERPLVLYWQFSLVRLKVPHGQCTERALCIVTFYLCDIRDEISLRIRSTIHVLSVFFLNLFSERKMQLVTSVSIWYDLKWLFYQELLKLMYYCRIWMDKRRYLEDIPSKFICSKIGLW